MRLVCMSDTHNQIHKFEFAIPDGDVFVFTGDLSGTSHDWCGLNLFKEFLNGLPHRHKIVIAGNHDFLFEKQKGSDLLCAKNIHYLEDSDVTIDGVRFYGTPYQPVFFDWAFNVENPVRLRRKWVQIPDETNVLLTHCAPYGILDRTVRGDFTGCPMLRDRVRELNQLKVHCFGHIHESYGVLEKEGVTYINSSTCDINYLPVNPPIVIDI